MQIVEELPERRMLQIHEDFDVVIEPSSVDELDDIDEKVGQETDYEFIPCLRPIVGEVESEFLKRHGVLKKILDGHKNFTDRNKISVGQMNFSVPDLLQQTGVFSGTVNTDRLAQNKQDLAICDNTTGYLSARKTYFDEEHP